MSEKNIDSQNPLVLRLPPTLSVPSLGMPEEAGLGGSSTSVDPAHPQQPCEVPVVSISPRCGRRSPDPTLWRESDEETRSNPRSGVSDQHEYIQSDAQRQSVSKEDTYSNQGSDVRHIVVGPPNVASEADANDDDEGFLGTGSMQRKVKRRLIKVFRVVVEFFSFTPLYRSVEEIEHMDVPTSLFIFGGTNPLRLFCLRLIQYSAFRGFILMCILLNSVLLALDEPLVNQPDTTANFMSVMDAVLTGIFTVEMVIKIIALGFVLHRNAYLRNGWNVLDCVIVVTSLLVTFVSLGGNVSALRVVRVLRPLRSINRVAKLKRLITGIFNALPAVADNVFLFLFILFVFAVGGIQLFLNDMSYRCYIEDVPAGALTVVPPVNVSMFNMSFPQLDATITRYCGGDHTCSIAQAQTSGVSGTVVLPTTCASHRDVFYTHNLNFDNFVGAMLLTLKIMSADNWPDNMQELIDSSGYAKAVIYLVILITVGSFFCVNLFLAILTSSYSEASGNGEVDEGEEDGLANGVSQRREIIVDDVRIVHDPSSTRALLPRVPSTRIPIKDTAIQCAIEREGAFLEKQLATIESEFYNVDEEETRKRVQLLISRRRSATPLSSVDGDALSSVAFTSAPSLAVEPPVGPPRSALKKEAPTLAVAVPTSGPQRVSRQSFMLARSVNNEEGGANSSLSGDNDNLGAHSFVTETVSEEDRLPRRRSRTPSAVLSFKGNNIDSFAGSGGLMSRSASASVEIEMDIPNFREPYTVIFTEDVRKSVVEAYYRQKKIELQQQRAVEGGPSVQEQEEALREAEDDLIDTSDDGSEGGSESTFTSASGFTETDSASQSSGTRSSSLSTRASLKRRRRREHRKIDNRAEWRKRLGLFLDTKAVAAFMTFITVLNVALLMADYEGISTDVSDAFNIIGIVCTCFFAIEISLKMVALGLVKTLRGKLNLLDLLLVILSVPDMVVNGGSSAFSSLRVFRLLRLLRLVKAFPSMQTVFGSAARSIVGSGYLLLLIGLFLFVYAVLGMQLFGTTYGVNDPGVRDSYGTFLDALLLCFIVVTADDWTDKMQVAMTDSSTPFDDFVAVAYFVSLFMIGNYILINLFVAIIMDRLEDEYTGMRKKQERAQRKEQSDVLIMPTLILPNLAHSAHDIVSSPKRSVSGSTMLSMGKRFADEAVEDYNRPSQRLARFLTWLLEYEVVPCGDGYSLFIFHPDNYLRKACRIFLGSRIFNIGLIWLLVANVIFIAFEGQPAPLSTAVDDSEEVFSAIFIAEMVINIIAYGLWFPRGLSKAEHVIELHAERKRKADEEDRRKEQTALTSTALSQMETEEALSATRNQPNLEQGEEMTIIVDGGSHPVPAYSESDPSTLRLPEESFPITMVASEEFKGLKDAEPSSSDYAGEWVIGPAYLRDWFNVVDAVVTITSFVGLFVPTFKIFRSLRTVRLLNNIESTRIVTVSLVKAVSNVLQGLIVVVFLFIVFGVMGVQFFKGKFYVCNDPAVYLREDCVGNYTAVVQGPLFTYPVETPREMSSLFYNFDNFGEAFITVFYIAVGDAWSHIMYNAMDTTTEGNGLRFKASQVYALYFVIAFMCTNFFAMNMIVGILISYFSKMKKENDGSLILTPKQRLFLKARSAIEASLNDVDVEPVANPISQVVHWLITLCLPQPEACFAIHDDHTFGGTCVYQVKNVLAPILRFFTRQSIFDYLILLVVMVNTIMLATISTDMSKKQEDAIGTVNNIALYIFTAEAALKLIAYFPAQYFLMAWNTFDFLIVALGWVDFALPGIPAVSFLRVLRISKLLRGTGVQRLLTTLFLSVRSFVNVSLLFVLNLFIFAAAGVVLFKDVRPNGIITESTNFNTVPQAFLLLFQIVTTESWADVLQATHLNPPNCKADGSDCGSVGRIPFFLLFMVFGNFVCLQLFVAVIVETFEEVEEDEEEDEDSNREEALGWQETPKEVLRAFQDLRGIWAERFGKKCLRVTVAEFVALLPYLPATLTMSAGEVAGPDARLAGSPAHNAGTSLLGRSHITQNLLKENSFLIRFLASLALPVDSEGMVQYRDVVYSLAYRKFNIDVRSYANMLHTTIFVFQTSFTAAEEYCSRMIQKRWTLYKRMKGRNSPTGSTASDSGRDPLGTTTKAERKQIKPDVSQH